MNKKIVFVSITMILLIIFVISFLYFDIYNIEGHSMNPTLYEYDKVIAVPPKNIKRGDIIAFKKENQTLAIKRVIGLPGETIEILSDGTVLINGHELEETYLNSKEIKRVEMEFPYTIPTGEYFVLGDNRSNSQDSRDPKVGLIKKSDIVGRVKHRIWPINRIGAVK